MMAHVSHSHWPCVYYVQGAQHVLEPMSPVSNATYRKEKKGLEPIVFVEPIKIIHTNIMHTCSLIIRSSNIATTQCHMEFLRTSKTKDSFLVFFNGTILYCVSFGKNWSIDRVF